MTFSTNEALVADDVTRYYFDYVRLGSASPLATSNGRSEIEAFAKVFTNQINAFYPKKPLQSAGTYTRSGITCTAFTFGDGKVDWSGSEELAGRLDHLLRVNRGQSLAMTRVARIYDGEFIFLLKPDRLRYWLSSTALRDADEVLNDLRAQGF